MSRLWWLMGVNTAVTAAMATVMTYASGGWPSAWASAMASGPNRAVVAESEPMNCTTTPTSANRPSRISVSLQLARMPCSQLASMSAVPLFFMAVPSGIAPAMNTNMRASMARYASRALMQRARIMAMAPLTMAIASEVALVEAAAI